MSRRGRLLVACAGLLAVLVALAIHPYRDNVSALLRITDRYAVEYDLPPGLVLMLDSGFDGMLYHQMAREIPAMLAGEAPVPPHGQPRIDRAYRWQRVLLPALAWAVSLGHERALPWAFLAINFSAILATLALVLATTGRADVHAASVVLNPAALFGLLFSTTEPLAMLAAAAFFWLWRRQGERITVLQVAVLALGLLAREVDGFLVGAVVLFLASRRRFGEAAAAASAFVPFAAWQVLLQRRFGDLPLAGNGNAILSLPFQGILDLFVGLARPTAVGLSALAYLVLFAAPLAALLASAWRQEREDTMVLLALTVTTGAMVVLGIDIWVAISGIGRVLPAMYPAYALVASRRDTTAWRGLSASLCLVSFAGALGQALLRHPWTLS